MPRTDDVIDLRNERRYRRFVEGRDQSRIEYGAPRTRPLIERADPLIVHRPTTLPIITLSEWQGRVFTNPARFRVKVCGRRSGKSFEDAVELIAAAVAKRAQVVWYVAPTYKSAKEIMWRQLKMLIPRSYLKRKPLETELLFEFLNDSILQLKGAEEPDDLRGPGLDYLSLDEFAYIDPRAWFEVMRPMVSDRMGRATFSTTPAGLNWAYDLCMKGRGEHPDWASFQVTSLQGGRIPADEIAQARDELSARVFRQEYEASFEAVGSRVYEEYDKTHNMREDIVDLPSQELLVGLDFNVNPMSGVLGVRAADQLHVFEAFEIMTSNTTEVAKWLRERFPNRRIIICPDPSGKARKTSAAGATDFSILEEHGMEIDASNAAPTVKDRINAVNALFCSAAGTRRCFVHPRVQKTLGRSLDGLTFKPGTNIPNQKGGLVHITDALGYLVWQQFNLLEDRDWSSVSVRY
jgi:hypothetical protein